MISKISKQKGKEMLTEFHLFIPFVLFLIGPLTCKWAIELIASDMVESLKQLQVASDQCLTRLLRKVTSSLWLHQALGFLTFGSS